MPRRLRNAIGGYVYHVLNRAAGRARLFKTQGDYAVCRYVERNALRANLVPGAGVRAIARCGDSTCNVELRVSLDMAWKKAERWPRGVKRHERHSQRLARDGAIAGVLAPAGRRSAEESLAATRTDAASL